MHLFYCDDFQCPSHFKCSDSYCIPVRHMCDGIQDCPYGEEEIQCNGHNCVGYFWCPVESLCLGFIDVCDGQVHCSLSHDDELLCNTISCPAQCACVGIAQNAQECPNVEIQASACLMIICVILYMTAI